MCSARQVTPAPVRSRQRAVSQLQALGYRVIPEHGGPQDRSWVVSCDYDLDELYIAAGDDVAQRLLDDRTTRGR